jgi:hypothetical protein
MTLPIFPPPHPLLISDKSLTEQLKIVYPKFKNGEATVRNVRVRPSYGELCTVKIIILIRGN